VAQHPDNIRDPGRGIRELTASIAEVGVLVPLIVVPVHAVPDHDFGPGVTHVAVDGNRRQAAARAAGLPLPCIVRPDLGTARDTALTMAVTGLARDGLTAQAEAGAVQTMLDLGIDPAAIGRARKQIAAARKAATLPAEVTAAVGEYPLTLAELAALAQWQKDPDATAELLDAIPRGQLDRAVTAATVPSDTGTPNSSPMAWAVRFLDRNWPMNR
jgi:ParB-like chromosome segregation protein Spo0J